MNILVFSPYRHTDNLGVYSTLLLKHCFANHKNITYKHINVNNSPVDPNTTLETNYFDRYDVVIQHCPYNYIRYIPGMKNIWIPIIDNICHIQDPYIEHYVKNIDSIFIENSFTEMVIAKSIESSEKIKVFDFTLDKEEKQKHNKIDLGKLNQSYKYYTILDYNADQMALFNLIKNFIAVYRNNNDFALVVLLACSTDQYENTINAISNIGKSLSVTGDISNVAIFATANIGISDTLPLHESCDTYLDIQSKVETIHHIFASLYGSDVSEKVNSDYSESYGYINHSSFGYKNKIYSLVSDSFDKIYKTSNKNEAKRKTLMEMLSEE